MKKKWIILFFSVIILAIGIAFFINEGKGRVSECAFYPMTVRLKKVITFQDCKVEVFLNDNSVSEVLIPSRDADGELFLALPSKCVGMRFINLSKDCQVKVAEHKYQNGEIILPDEIGENAIISLCVQGEERETMSLFLSENVGTFFVITNVSQDELDAEKGKKYSGRVSYYGDTSSLTRKIIKSIKTRGNSTFRSSDKKSYEISFKDGQPLLGDEDYKKWILLSDCLDDTLLKNAMVLSTAGQLDKIKTPKFAYVDLYINGQYRGNYLLCEKPQEIVFEEGIKEPHYLIEFRYLDQMDEGDVYFQTADGKYARIREPEDASDATVSYVSGLLEELREAAVSQNGICERTGRSISDYLDISSYAMRYLIELLFANIDSHGASSYFYIIGEQGYEKIYAGPIWDYDLTLLDYTQFEENDIDTYGRIFLCDELISHDEVRKVVKELYTDFLRPFIKYSFPQLLYSLNSQVSVSRKLNDLKWGIIGVDDEIVIDNFIAKVNSRMKVIEERVLEEDGYAYVSFYDRDGDLIEKRNVLKGNVIEDIPCPVSWAFVFNGWTDAETGELLQNKTRIWEDKTYVANWIDVSLIVINGLEIADINPEQVDYDTLKKVYSEILAMEEK